MKPRILISSMLFNERTSYQEVICAREFARMGCEVLVVCVQHTPGPEPGPWRVVQLEKRLRVRDTVFLPRGLQKIVDDFRPRAAFLYAPNHGLAHPFVSHLPPECKVVPVFGDLRESHRLRRGRWLSVRGNPLLKRMVKDRWYRKLLRRADLILSVTPETVRLLRELDAPAVDARGWMCGLAADPTMFFHDPAQRTARDPRKTLITVTRIFPEKAIDHWIQPVMQFLRKHPEWRYVLAGLPPGPAGETVKQELLAAAPPGQMEVLPLLSQQEMNRAFNEADIAVWYMPSITIQQSMMTGLPVLLPQVEALSHLVHDGENGFNYPSQEDLVETLERAAARQWDHGALAAENARLSSAEVFARILQRLNLSGT